MIDALLARAATRFVFVVGKGGVGKTTTAGAFALALADRSQPTHLVSTDPAHSLGDLFHQDLRSGTPARSACNDVLLLEEFAARAYAENLFAELRAPLIDLIERGTYLDTSDATSFLDLSIPGIDEAMSALRLVDLYDVSILRVVVDTAPTGHTMRLLDAARTIRSWVAAGRAMAEKAGVVAAYLVGRRVSLAAEPLLDQLEMRALRFDDAVLRDSSAIVVTRPGQVIAAETQRLIAYLGQRGIPIAAIVAGSGGANAHFEIGTLTNPTGCDGLRAWTRQLRKASPAMETVAHTRAQQQPRSQPVEQWLRSLQQKLLLVAGKGGVGKSTCSAAIAGAVAHERRVCVVSTDPAGSLSDIFGVTVPSTITEVDSNLYAQQVDAALEFRRMRETYRDRVGEVLAEMGLDASLRLDRNVIESLWNFAPPGIDELIALLDILERADEFDVLVIDAAPTGHFLRLIELPDIAREWVHSLLRLLLKYSSLGSLDALARDLLGFAKNLRQLQMDLSTPGRAAVFVVTLDQPVVAAETSRLAAAVERAQLPVAATILNRADSATNSMGEQADFARMQTILAPNVGEEIIGPAALRAFVEQWEFSRE